MTDGAPETEDDLDKIALLAWKRGYWDERAAREGAAMARLHHEGPRTFLKKLLERKCGVTYDEVARLEKDALAPPPLATPSKPLPRLGIGKPASSDQNPALGAPQEIVTEARIPKLDDKAPATQAPPPPPPPENEKPTRPLPRLNAPRKPKPDG
jgi:hypothetical protein